MSREMSTWNLAKYLSIELHYQRTDRMAAAIGKVFRERGWTIVRYDDQHQAYVRNQEAQDAIARRMRDEAATLAEGRGGVPTALSEAIRNIPVRAEPVPPYALNNS